MFEMSDNDIDLIRRCHAMKSTARTTDWGISERNVRSEYLSFASAMRRMAMKKR